MNRLFTLKPNSTFSPCPRCGNNEVFKAVAERFAEDCCEVWVECAKCGHDPTAEGETAFECDGTRMEDVWGSLDPETIQAAMYVREELL